MRLYHTTTKANAEAILQGGFRDATGSYGFVRADGTPDQLTGVWFADVPLDGAQFGEGVMDTVLTIDLDMPEEAITQYEWTEEANPSYCEFLIPAVVANQHGRIVKVEWDTLGPLTLEDWRRAAAEYVQSLGRGD